MKDQNYQYLFVGDNSYNTADKYVKGNTVADNDNNTADEYVKGNINMTEGINRADN